MTQEPITPASLAAFLAANTVVPMMLGKLEMRTPAIGVQLTDEQRAQIGLAPGGVTFVYELNEGEVVMDLSGNTATISFAKGDVATAIGTFDRLLKRDRPELRQTEDVAHPRGGAKRLRVYEGDIEPMIVCKVEADYPDRGASGMDNRFIVRVSAFEKLRN